MMPIRISIDLDERSARRARPVVAEMQLEFPREVAAAAALRDWLVGAGYLPDDLIEEDTRPQERHNLRSGLSLFSAPEVRPGLC
jgi:hypothetical protein